MRTTSTPSAFQSATAARRGVGSASIRRSSSIPTSSRGRARGRRRRRAGRPGGRRRGEPPHLGADARLARRSAVFQRSAPARRRPWSGSSHREWPLAELTGTVWTVVKPEPARARVLDVDLQRGAVRRRAGPGRRRARRRRFLDDPDRQPVGVVGRLRRAVDRAQARLEASPGRRRRRACTAPPT